MFRRRPVVVRRTPGVVGTVARTAAVAGTAAVTTHAVSSHYQKQAAAAQADQLAVQEADQVAELQQQVASLQAQQVQDAVPAPATPAPAGGSDLMSQLTQLAQMKDAGILSEAEFEAAKAKLLAG